MGKRKSKQKELEEVYTETEDHKRPCPDCGLPRDPEYAERAACACCGRVGLGKKKAVTKEVPKLLFDILL